MFGDFHGADLGGNTGADASGQHKSSDGRCKLLNEEAQKLWAELTEVTGDAIELLATLHDHDHAEKAHGHADEEQRLVADVIHLPGKLAARVVPLHEACETAAP